ncbi:MAG: AraC family transcriptional regulator [Prevotellaceae bacterium]|nr:AraC family transcriptional regulator [Prevotellaceae bacterium]
MRVKIPDMSLSATKLPETEHISITNCYADAAFQTFRTPQFSITDMQIRSRDDVKMYYRVANDECLWFCAALQGSITSSFNAGNEDKWQNGQVNMLACSDIEGYTCFKKGKSVQILNLILSANYLEQMAAGSDLLNEILEQHACRRFTRATPEPLRFCPRTGKAIRELLDYEIAGNIAPMYLDAKIREILSLFLCRMGQDNCAACNCYSPDDDDILLHAKTIIEQEYRNPPSLRQLALMVGTNECKLKKGFKSLFGTTVFGYLFNYRMETACRHLSDTGKTIQEVAELSGYEYQSHFTTAFRRKFCMSPMEYRQRIDNF